MLTVEDWKAHSESVIRLPIPDLSMHRNSTTRVEKSYSTASQLVVNIATKITLILQAVPKIPMWPLHMPSPDLHLVALVRFTGAHEALLLASTPLLRKVGYRCMAVSQIMHV